MENPNISLLTVLAQKALIKEVFNAYNATIPELVNDRRDRLELAIESTDLAPSDKTIITHYLEYKLGVKVDIRDQYSKLKTLSLDAPTNELTQFFGNPANVKLKLATLNEFDVAEVQEAMQKVEDFRRQSNGKRNSR